MLVILWLGAIVTGQQQAYARDVRDSSQDINAMQRLLTAEVPVNSQASRERTRALQTAFSEVLVRVSGHASVLQTSTISSELSRSEERRVGKECRSLWLPSHMTKREKNNSDI